MVHCALRGQLGGIPRNGPQCGKLSESGVERQGLDTIPCCISYSITQLS